MRIYHLLMATMLLSIVGFTSCGEKEVVTPDPDPIITLAEEEAAQLIYLREEEKLARDVYLYFDNKYNQQIFKNISASEQSHMDAILVLLGQYELEDPALSEEGVFSNEDLQTLYNALIKKGDSSLLDALQVGATIEDVDILDLQHAIDKTTQADIISVYEKLMCGSTNHMRGFTNWLQNNGGTYTPQFITQDEYDAIISSEHQNCNN